MPLWKRTYRCENYGSALDRSRESAARRVQEVPCLARITYVSEDVGGILQKDYHSVEVTLASCVIRVHNENCRNLVFTVFKKAA